MKAEAGIQQFAKTHGIEWFCTPTIEQLRSGQFDLGKVNDFLVFQVRINKEMLRHRAITANSYAEWFEGGLQDKRQICNFLVQFSVLANQLLLSQRERLIEWVSVGHDSSHQVHLKNIGIVYHDRQRSQVIQSEPNNIISPDSLMLSSRFTDDHFDWLVLLSECFGLERDHLGARIHGTESTLMACDEINRLYNHPDRQVSQAAVYAIENWLVTPFWEQLLNGFKRYQQRNQMDYLPLMLFHWHACAMGEHVYQAQQELEMAYFGEGIDEEAFIATGIEMLDAIQVFWSGLLSAIVTH